MRYFGLQRVRRDGIQAGDPARADNRGKIEEQFIIADFDAADKLFFCFTCCFIALCFIQGINPVGLHFYFNIVNECNI